MTIKRIIRKIKHLIYTLFYLKGVKRNVYKTTYSKKALLSYIKLAYHTDTIDNSQRMHTNHLTTRIIGDILNELGYQVDVIDWSQTYKDSLNNYAIVIGLGNSLEEALLTPNRSYKVVWFGTGCNPFYSNIQTIKKLAYYHNENQTLNLSSTRYIIQDSPLQHEFADAIILHGAEFALSTYRKTNIDNILAPVFIYHQFDAQTKDWTNAKKNYLWFGGGGAIHKGLDLCIDYFKNHPENNLHICGGYENEKGFWAIYRKKVELCTNIHSHGFVDISSINFANILSQCAFVILPSVSEGNCASVITCMVNAGLIPIVTESTDIEQAIRSNTIIIDDFDIPSVGKAVQYAQTLSENTVKEMAIEIYKYTTKYHSFENFRENFKQNLTKIV